MSQPELLPCPFCGNSPELINRLPGSKKPSQWDVKCNTPGCYMELGADWFLTKKVAIEMWNTRHD